MKKVVSFLTILVFLFALSTPVYAITTVGEGGGTTDSGGDISGESGAPKISDILNPVIRVVNIALGAGALIFITMLFWAGYRYSLSQGDPKEMVLAKATLTHAIQGFLVVVGSFTIIAIAGSIFGIQQDKEGKVGEPAQNALQELEDFFKRAQ